MIGPDRRGNDESPDTGEVTRIVTLEDSGTKRLEVRRSGRIRIATTHGNPTAAGYKCERTHAGSTDSHEVNGAFIRGVEQGHY
jgi:hypothetical protein